MSSFFGEANTHEGLIKKLIKEERIKDERIINALKKYDRKFFVRPESAMYAYEDHPLGIGYGATISAPHMHAIALKYLKDKLVPGAKVLDVGAGSGYLTAVM